MPNPIVEIYDFFLFIPASNTLYDLSNRVQSSFALENTLLFPVITSNFPRFFVRNNWNKNNLFNKLLLRSKFMFVVWSITTFNEILTVFNVHLFFQNPWCYSVVTVIIFLLCSHLFYFLINSCMWWYKPSYNSVSF